MTNPLPPADRYGRARRPRLTIVVIAVALLALFGTWVGWVMATDRTSGIAGTAIDTRVVDHRASILYRVDAPAGTAVSCALRTLDSRMATTGWTVRHLAAQPSGSTTYRATVYATSTPAAVEVFRCWRSTP